MVLPKYEEISIGVTRTFVNKNDIERFEDYMESLNDIVIPIENKAKECDIRHIIEDGHIAETAIGLLNKEILRMIYWSKHDFKHDTERMAKKFKDTKDRYIAARYTLQYDCQCTKRK